jgi:hypothetical protein
MALRNNFRIGSRTPSRDSAAPTETSAAYAADVSGWIQASSRAGSMGRLEVVLAPTNRVTHTT